MLRLYNTMTRRKEAFTPLDAKNVRMYVCGPTVYDYAHIGNARPVIVFDTLFRLLRHLYGEKHVTYVANVTDVDDKINARAHESGITIRELTETTLSQYKQDRADLLCFPPSFEPRVTDFIAREGDALDIVKFIELLVERGHAYEAEGHVLFHVPSMKNYGALSKRPMDEMIAGARVDVAPYKKDPADFVLWKPSSPDLPGWDSPWGRGRPGWHIECSAMAGALLGPEFDIHGGGIDLVFPHHENEMAQTCCAFNVPQMAQIWMHNGFLQMEGTKMSKSLGNFATIREVLNEWPGEAARLTMLKAHYKQPMDWTVAGLKESEKTISQWYERAGDAVRGDIDEEFLAALCDDLNTPLAISKLHQLDGAALKASARLIGLLPGTAAQWKAAKQAKAKIDETAINQLISERNAARATKNFAESDRIRDELTEMGIRIKDNADGSTAWEAI